jgi:hypothetical protein
MDVMATATRIRTIQRYIRMAVVFLLLAMARITAAQPKIPIPHCMSGSQLGSMTLRIEGRTSTAPAAGPGLHWVVVSLPAESDIMVADDALKAAIMTWVSAQNALAPGDRHEWILDGKNNANLFKSSEPGSLVRTLSAQFTITFTQLQPPEAVAPEQSVRISFCFASLAAPPQIKTIEIEVFTRSRVTPSATATLLTEPLPQLAPGVTARALLTDSDFATASEKGRVLRALAALSQRAFDLAQDAGLRIGTSPRNAALRQIELAVSTPYDMQQPTLPGFAIAWPNIGSHTVFPPTGNLVLQISGVTVAKAARIEIDLGGIQPASSTGVSKALKLACLTQERLNKQFAAELANFSYQVPTFDQIDTLRSEIAESKEINPSTTPVTVENQNTTPTPTKCANAPSGNDSRVIIFHASNRWRSFGFKASGGIGYSPEQKVTGTGTFDADNLLLKLPDNGQPRETENISYSGGNELQRLDGKWALDWTHQHSSLAQTDYGVHLSADYVRDNDQRFGNLRGPHLRDREAGAMVTGVYSFTSKPVNAEGNAMSHRYALSASVGLEYRRIEIRPANGNNPPPLLSGAMTAASGDVAFDYRYEPFKAGGGFGGLEFSVAANGIHGLNISEFAFTRVASYAAATIYFGHHHPRDFFIRARKGAGTGNNGTPIFELFRLGGSNNIRGIEEGEFVGRKIGYEQFETGISVREVVSWFSSKANEQSESSEPSPLDLSRFYIKAFYDRGRVTDAANFSDLINLHHAAKGYGFAVEIQGLEAQGKRIVLSLGYARSNDSVLHPSGFAITSASISF